MQHPLPPQPPGLDRVAILKFDDRNRYGTDGVPATLLYGGGVKYIVKCKTQTKLNQWAKVKLRENNDEVNEKNDPELQAMGDGDYFDTQLKVEIKTKKKKGERDSLGRKNRKRRGKDRDDDRSAHPTR